jgi:hypothetical protein
MARAPVPGRPSRDEVIRQNAAHLIAFLTAARKAP